MSSFFEDNTIMGCCIAAFCLGVCRYQRIFLRNASRKENFGFVLSPPPPVCLFRPDTSREEKRDMVEPGKEGLKVAPDTSVEEGDEEENSGGRGKTLDSKLSMAPKKKILLLQLVVVVITEEWRGGEPFQK